MPLVSVIMPVYNAQRFLRESIESVLNQTFTDFEFLIFNDASTDDSLKIISSYSDARIKVVESPSNKGYLVHLNEGIRLAKGKYIARMDADDICLPHRFQQQLEFLESNERIGLVGSNCILINGEGKIVQNLEFPQNHKELIVHLFFYTAFIHPSIIVKKSIAEKHLYQPDYYPAEDYHFFNVIGYDCNLACIPEKLLHYRMHGNNISISKRAEQIVSIQKTQKILLHRLGIYNLTPAQIQFHWNVVGDLYWGANSKINNHKTLCWILILIKKNSKKNIYDQEYFKNQLKRNWNNSFKIIYTPQLRVIKFLWHPMSSNIKFYNKILIIIKIFCKWLIKRP